MTQGLENEQMMDGGGMMGDDGPPYDTFTINGKAFPATEPLKVRRGERVRLRLINASNMQTFTLRLVGHRLQVTHTDGNPLQENGRSLPSTLSTPRWPEDAGRVRGA